MYQVTARKWRPQTFPEVVGQEHITRTLQNALRQGRIAHAYLFAGTRGVGKTTTARLLAKALNCENGPTPDPCNACSLCQAIIAGNALDVLEIDGASNRGIDEIRDLREKIRYAPARGRYKIYIIDEVHMLTEFAFNALLKTLEEPPPQVVFLFATTEPHKVPITILSRCQRFDFRRVDSTEIAECLQKIAEHEGFQLSSVMLHRIARQAGGSLRDAQTLFDQVVASSGGMVQDEQVAALLGMGDDEQIRRLVDAILARDPRAVVELIAPMFQQGYDTREICRQLLEHVRDLIVLKVTPRLTGVMDRSPAELEALQKLGAQVSVEELYTLFELLTETETKVRDSAHPIWVLEVALMKLASLPRMQALSQLITRLEALEQHLGRAYDAASAAMDSQPNAVYEHPPTVEPTLREEAAVIAATTDIPVDAGMIQKIIDSASNRPLGWILEQHCRLQLTEQELEVVFHGRNRLAQDLLQEQDTLRTLQEIARATTGRDIKVRIVATQESNGASMAAAQDPSQDDNDLTSLSRTGIVRETLELFGGRILDIRRRAGSQDATGPSMAEEGIAGEEEEHDDE